MSDAPVVGSASFELRATKDKLGQDIRSAQADLKNFGDKAEQDLGGSTGRIGASIGRMASTAALGIAALAAGLALAAKAAFDFSFAAVKVASDFEKSATSIGISTNALQEWRHVAQQTGADARDADKALDSFATKLAQASAGTSKEASKAFSFLRIGRDELRGFDSVESALDTVVDKIKDLRSEADRAAVAEALGLGPLSNALRDSAVDIAALRDEAHELGVVMDAELIRRAADAQEKFDTLSQVIDVQLKSAFLDLAPAIMAAITLVAQLATALNDAMDAWRSLDSRTSRGLRRTDDEIARRQNELVERFGSRAAMTGQRTVDRPVPGFTYSPVRQASSGVDFGSLSGTRALDAGEHFDALQQLRVRVGAEEAERAARNVAPERSDRPTGSSLTLPPGRPGRVDRSAEREARRSERVEQEIFRARQRLLDVVDEEFLTAQQRFDLAQQQLAMEREARDAEIERKTQRGEIKAAERAELDAANQAADSMEDRVLADNAFREIQDERLASEKLLADLAADLVSLQISGARTAKDRLRLEQELLAITQRQRREAMELELERDPSLTPEQRASYRANNARREQMENAAVGRANMSPLQAWRDEALKSAAEVDEAYENVAARGLDSLNDGIVDAIMNSRSLGEVFHNVAQQILADLLQISVRRGITEPLANALFPQGGAAGGGGLGSAWSSISSLFSGLRIPGFSSGVSNFSGGLAYVHAGEVLANLAPGTDVIPSHAVGGGRGSPIHFDLRGAVMTSDLLEQMEGMAMESGGAALSGARNVVPADMARSNRYSLKGR